MAEHPDRDGPPKALRVFGTRRPSGSGGHSSGALDYVLKVIVTGEKRLGCGSKAGARRERKGYPVQAIDKGTRPGIARDRWLDLIDASCHHEAMIGMAGITNE